MKNKQQQEKEPRPYCSMLEGAEEVTGRKYSERWELEVVKMINEFKLTTTAGKAAEDEHWFGVIYPNYVVTPYGLAFYLFQIYSKWIFIKDIFPTVPKAARLNSNIDEFGYDQNYKFHEWLNSKWFYAKAINGEPIDIVGMIADKKGQEPSDRRIDFLVLRKKGMERWKSTQEHLEKNPNLLQNFIKGE